MRIRLLVLMSLWGMLAVFGSVTAQDSGTSTPTAMAHEVMLISSSAPVFWSPDSHFIVVTLSIDSASQGAKKSINNSYGVFDVLTGKFLFDVPVFIDWLPDSNYIIARDGDNMDAQVREVQTGKVMAILQGAQIGWKWNTNHTQAASESSDNNLHLYDVASGTLLQTWRNILVKDALWNDDGKLIAVIGLDTILRVYDVMTGSLKAQLLGYQPVGWSSDDRQLIVTPKERTFPSKLGLWTLENGAAVMFDVLNLGYLWSPDRKLLAIAGTDQSVYIIDTTTRKEVQKIAGFQSNIQLFRWDLPDRLIVVTGDYGAGINPAFEVFNLQTGKRTLKADFDITAASHITDDRLEIIQLCSNICKLVYDLNTGQQRSRTDFSSSKVSSSVLVSPDYQWVLNTVYPDGAPASTPDQFLHLYNLQTAEVSVLPGYKDFILYSTWSPDSHFFAVASQNSVRIWAVEPP